MREDTMSRMLRNTLCIKSEEERKTEEALRREEIDLKRQDEQANGVHDEDLTPSLRNTVLQEYVRLYSHAIGRSDSSTDS